MTMDGTTKIQDSQAVPDTSEKKSETPKDTGTFTKEQVEAIAKKAASDALAAAGRTAKQLKEQQEALQRRESEIASRQANWQREQDEREIAAVKDDPEALSAVRLRQRARDEREQAERDKSEALRIKAEAIADRISGIAEKSGVDPEELMTLSHGDPDTARRIAQYLPKANATSEKPKDKEVVAEANPLHIDSGKTTGGNGKGHKPTLEELQSSSPAQTVKNYDTGIWI